MVVSTIGGINFEQGKILRQEVDLLNESIA